MGEEFKHVILLSADALRADHLSCYGYERDTSPNIDEFSEDSIKFTNAYSASSHTREAVPALLTGKYPDEAVDEGYDLASDTIASTLSDEGFATGGFHSNPYVSRAYGFDRGFDKFDDDLHLGQNKFIALAQRALDKLRNRHYARAEEINERSLSWIDSLEDGQPFFLWNHYMDTHGPYEPPGEYGTLYADEGLSSRDAQSLYQRALDDPESITKEERKLLIDLYDGEIRYNDMRIGEFLGELRDRELLEKSLLIVTADHGDAFREHGYYEHPRYLHEELTHIPLFIRGPGAESRDVDSLVSLLDIRNTIERWAGVSDSRSLLGTPSEERTIFSQARGEGDEDNIIRFAARRDCEVCFCEYDRELEDFISFESPDSEVRSIMENHVLDRGQDNKDADSSESTEISEVDRRLKALGYKE